MLKKGCLMGFLALSGLAHAAPSVDIEEEMEYSEARAILLKAGWQDFSTNIDENGEAVCYRDVEDISDCEGMEIADCEGSGEGHCAMTYFDGDKTYLNIVTKGGPPPEAFVSSWGETTEKPEMTIHSAK